MAKFKSVLKYFVIILVLLPCAMIFTACGPSTAEKLAGELGYSSVEQMVESMKGKDGKDGTNSPTDTYQMWKQAVEKGEFDANKTYLDFLRELNISCDVISPVASKCVMSVVTVYVNSNSRYSKSGSGVIYSIGNNEAYVITNFHVVSNDSSILTGERAYKNFYLTLYGMDYEEKFIAATYVGGSLNYDLAVLKVTDPASLKILKDANAQPAVFVQGAIKPWTDVIAVGNPRPSDNSGNSYVEGIAVTRGVISVVDEEITIEIANRTPSIEEIRNDCYIDTGSSGGGLFNLNGELVGITNGGIDNYESINYAIPADTTLGVVRNIISHCNSSNDQIVQFKPFEIKATNTQSFYNENTKEVELTQLISVKSVDSKITYKEGSNALAVNDIIQSAVLHTSSHGDISITVSRTFHLERLLLNASAGDTLTLKVLKNGSSSAVEVTITLTADVASYYA